MGSLSAHDGKPVFVCAAAFKSGLIGHEWTFCIAGCVVVAERLSGAGRVFEVGFERVGIGAGDLYLFIRDLHLRLMPHKGAEGAAREF